MSAEVVPSPGKIVGYSDLETLARRKAPAIHRAFDADMANHDGVFGSEFRPNPICGAYLENLTTLLTDAIASEDNMSTNVFVHTSLRLGVMIAGELLSPKPIILSSAGMRDRFESVDDFYRYAIDSPMDYLYDGRDTLHDLLDRYTAPFSPTGPLQSRAVLLGGLSLLHVEMEQYDQFRHEQAARFRGAVEILDSNRTSET